MYVQPEARALFDPHTARDTNDGNLYSIQTHSPQLHRLLIVKK